MDYMKLFKSPKDVSFIAILFLGVALISVVGLYLFRDNPTTIIDTNQQITGERDQKSNTNFQTSSKIKIYRNERLGISFEYSFPITVTETGGAYGEPNINVSTPRTQPNLNKYDNSYVFLTINPNLRLKPCYLERFNEYKVTSRSTIAIGGLNWTKCKYEVVGEIEPPTLYFKGDKFTEIYIGKCDLLFLMEYFDEEEDKVQNIIRSIKFF